MDEEKCIDLDGIRVALCRGEAICSVMSGFSDEEDLDAESVRSLGFELFAKFKEIQNKLGL